MNGLEFYCFHIGKSLENGLVRSECFTIGAEFNILVWIGAVGQGEL